MSNSIPSNYVQTWKDYQAGEITDAQLEAQLKDKPELISVIKNYSSNSFVSAVNDFVQLYDSLDSTSGTTSINKSAFANFEVDKQAIADVFALMLLLAKVSNEVREQGTELKWAQLDAYEKEINNYLQKLEDAAVTALVGAIVSAAVTIAMAVVSAIGEAKSIKQNMTAMETNMQANKLKVEANNMRKHNAVDNPDGTKKTGNTVPDSDVDAPDSVQQRGRSGGVDNGVNPQGVGANNQTTVKVKSEATEINIQDQNTSVASNSVQSQPQQINSDIRINNIESNQQNMQQGQLQSDQKVQTRQRSETVVDSKKQNDVNTTEYDARSKELQAEKLGLDATGSTLTGDSLRVKHQLGRQVTEAIGKSLDGLARYMEAMENKKAEEHRYKGEVEKTYMDAFGEVAQNSQKSHDIFTKFLDDVNNLNKQTAGVLASNLS